ncbi:MAG: hypothetical protein WEE64_08780 [Dehalococcoidia bacterium]
MIAAKENEEEVAKMERNTFQEAADRLGLMAYMFVMSGGRPDWQMLTLQAPQEVLEAQGTAGDLRGLLETTVPLEVGREHEDAAA